MIKKYRGYVVAYNKENEEYEIFTKEEYQYGKGYRYPEWSADTMDGATEWIDGTINNAYEDEDEDNNNYNENLELNTDIDDTEEQLELNIDDVSNDININNEVPEEVNEVTNTANIGQHKVDNNVFKDDTLEQEVPPEPDTVNDIPNSNWQDGNDIEKDMYGNNVKVLYSKEEGIVRYRYIHNGRYVEDKINIGKSIVE